MPKRTTPLPTPNTTIPQTFSDPPSTLPKVLVFDLDYTLWPFWCDTHISTPISPLTGAAAGTGVTDRRGDTFSFYSGVPTILSAARSKGLKIAAASRTEAPPLADKLLRLLTVDGRPAKEFFDDLQIFPGTKTRHVDGIKEQLGLEYSEMLFFDDESRNRNVERERGVAFWLVRDGVTAEEIDKGVKYWRERKEKAAGGKE